MYDRIPINILIAGVGGQGNLLASRLLADVALEKDYQVAIGETKGASQRSGSVTSHVRFSSSPQGPLIPRGSAHIIVGFEPLETLRASRKYSSPKTTVLVDSAPIVPMMVAQGLQHYPPLDEIVSELDSLNKHVYVVEATELARTAGNPIVMNVVMLGALCGLRLLPFAREQFADSIDRNVPTKHRKLNRRAFEGGYEQGRMHRATGREEDTHA